MFLRMLNQCKHDWVILDKVKVHTDIGSECMIWLCSCKNAVR